MEPSSRSNAPLFSIGEFSRITGLTVKTLRFYHEEGLLVPAAIDPASNYRFYRESQIELARAIAWLRRLELSIADIRELLDKREHEEGVLALMERHKNALRDKVARYRRALKEVDAFLTQERQAYTMSDSVFQIEEKLLPSLKVAGIRTKGRYADCGKAFGRIGRSLGRHLAGKPLLLHYDAEYKEEDADFEACFPVSGGESSGEINVHELPATRSICLMHLGPYEQLGNSYARILQHIKSGGHQILMPTREIYHKGPGIIFRGNPKKYLTEIQIPIAT